jgi:leader peptidase (prepilin peptidase)/N-methyltransferase
MIDTSQLFVVIVGMVAILGLLIGSFLNVVIHRVPAGISLMRPSQCPSCDAPVRPWQNVPVLSWIALRGRCARCRTSISLRYPLVELGTAAAFAAVAWWWTTQAHPGGLHVSPTLPDGYGIFTAILEADPWSGPIAAQAVVLIVMLWLAASGIALAIIDLDVRRLPAPIVRTAIFAITVLLVLACLLGADWWALARAGISMLLLYVFYALLRAARPGGMGGGDVRLAALIGLVLGWLGLPELIIGAFAAFVLGAAYGGILLLIRRAKRTSAIPFGPWILVGAWIGIVVGEPIGRWYVGLMS